MVTLGGEFLGFDTPNTERRFLVRNYIEAFASTNAVLVAKKTENAKTFSVFFCW